jgi:hypothetical protein
MAMRKRTARRAHVDRHGGQPAAAPTVTVACDLGRHRQCKGELISLLATGPCRCQCHTREGAAA